MRRLLRGIALITATTLGFALLPPALAADAELPVRVTVEGRPVLALEGATVGELMASLGLQPGRGNLLSIKGRILRRSVVSGRFLVNGAQVAASHVVQEGDAITMVAGIDVREPVERVSKIIDYVAGNPVRSVNPAYGLPEIVMRGLISKEVVRRIAVPGKIRSAIALTFDDGPDPTWTPAVLDVLAAYKVRATFFVTGRNSSRYPHLIRRIRAGGHTVQNHSWNHENLARLAPHKQWASLRDTIRALRAQGVATPAWFRPPYGAFTPTTVRLALALGMKTMIWNNDPADYRRPPAKTLVQRVVAQARPGGIILMHDAGGDRAQTVASLPGIIQTLTKRGYRFVAF